ncbi:hypothetical protein Pla163_01100 [Planctomycetes bacterium Pla163]|uniref:Chemotaxis phosphatase CheX-like domain-containing protein n=1 Tax=Rohdeia mirabilis TaxID=2528008 RepID=A0A518CUY2_9BACT|nr:hypothetical protein Pla163_01100 [Planctomycetes bacterium Pla163]
MPTSATPNTSPATAAEAKLTIPILERVVDDLAMIVDRNFTISKAQVSRIDRRAAGKDCVHISFKLRFDVDGEDRFGALLVPLADAIGLASYLMMMTDQGVAEHRGDTELDQSMKDGILEVGNFVGGAVDAIVRESHGGSVRVKSHGCQGVRPNVRPAFPFNEGDPLLLVSATAQLHTFDPFEILLMLPELDPA